MYILPVYIASIVCQDESPFIVGQGTHRMLEADTKIEISQGEIEREREDYLKMSIKYNFPFIPPSSFSLVSIFFYDPHINEI